MKDECRSLMAALSVNVLTVYMFLSVFFLPGVWAECSKPSFLHMSAPKQLEALSGSCLIIPCSFDTTPGNGEKFDNSRETFGVWIKNNTQLFENPNNVIFNSSKKENIYPMKIIGNLRQKNCTTLFSNLTTKHTERYYFRIEDGEFKVVDRCNFIEINIQDSPQSPSIEIPAVLKEKTSVSITCSAPTPCPHSPPELTWNLQADSQRQTETNTDGSFTTKIQKTITLSDTHDGFTIRCSARYPVNEGPPKTAETLKTLNMLLRTPSVSISPSASVSVGIWVKMTCSSRAKPAVINFIWFRSSKDGDQKVAEGESYSLNATEGGAYYCVATNDLGNQTSPKIDLIVGDNLYLTYFIIGGVAVTIILISFVICIWRFRKNQKQQQQQPTSELELQSPAPKTEDDLHYGEVNFKRELRILQPLHRTEVSIRKRCTQRSKCLKEETVPLRLLTKQKMSMLK
ncbi:Myelin-associated glycoprotein [Oryzias melastigma]|uniref:Myelin-associated glycoprotein n=1 Tax=Oryzias melastigma TaxID=30732 RepID=A0A834F7T0_ORYME|nr:Myelin-associated glycoprotein [Oryzias melastigma]